MPVFDPRQGQVLFSPVTNYYKGKAIRQELADKKQMSELRGLQIDALEQEVADAPSKKAQADRMAALKYADMLSGVRKRELEIGEKQMEQARNVLGPFVAEYARIAKEDEGAAITWANKEFPNALSRLPEERQAEYFATAGEDKVLDPSEISSIGLSLKVYEADKDPDPTAHQKTLDDLVERGFITPEERNKLLLDIEKKAGTVTGTTEFDPNAPKDPRTGSQKGAAFETARVEYTDSGDLREMITDYMPKAIALPSAVGGTAKLAANVAAIASILGSDAAGDVIMKNLSKTDQETLSQMQTQLTLIRSQVRPIATGDSGTRQSDSERRIANQVVQLTENLDKPSELLKNFPRAMGALKQLTVETYVRQYQVAKRHEGLDYPYDLSSDEGKLGFLNDLSEAGFDEGSALDALARLERIQTSD